MERDRDVIKVLNEIVGRKPRWGFWKLHDRLRLEGCRINHKRLHRVYCEMGLNLPRRTRRRLPVRARRWLAAPAGLNVIWAADFMADALYGGRWFRTLNVIDEGNRQALGIEVATSIPSARVIRVLEQLIEMHGKPTALRVDNGAEFTPTRSRNGAPNRTSSCSTSSQESPTKTPLLSDSIAPTARKCLMRTCSILWSKYAKSLNCGSRNITRSGHTTALAVFRP